MSKYKKKEEIIYPCPNNARHLLRQNVTYTDMRTCDKCKEHWTVIELVQVTNRNSTQNFLIQNIADGLTYPFVAVEISPAQKKILINYRNDLKKLPREFQAKISIDTFCKALVFETFKLRNDEKKEKREALNEKSNWKEGFKDLNNLDIDWGACEYESLKMMGDSSVVLTTDTITIVRKTADPFGAQVEARIPWKLIEP